MADIVLIDKPITRQKLKEVALQRFGDMVKAVVDIEKKIMAISGELHADEEAFLLQQGSGQSSLWGINIYPDIDMPGMIEFDSMINIRPNQGNKSRNVEEPDIQKKIIEIVVGLID